MILLSEKRRRKKHLRIAIIVMDMKHVTYLFS